MLLVFECFVWICRGSFQLQLLLTFLLLNALIGPCLKNVLQNLVLQLFLFSKLGMVHVKHLHLDSVYSAISKLPHSNQRNSGL